MKNFKIFTFLFLLAFNYIVGQSNASNGPLTTPNFATLGTLPSFVNTFANFESFRFRPGLITQLDNDDTTLQPLFLGSPTSANLPFDFLANSQWLSMGRLTFPTTTLYGFRTQRAGRGLVMGFKGPKQVGDLIVGTAPTLGDAVIEWLGNGGSATAGNLTFATSSTSTGGLPTQVMKMREDATCTISTASLYDALVANAGTQGTRTPLAPKLEINSFEGNRLALDVTSSVNGGESISGFFTNINDGNGARTGDPVNSTAIVASANAKSTIGTSIGISTTANGSFKTTTIVNPGGPFQNPPPATTLVNNQSIGLKSNAGGSKNSNISVQAIVADGTSSSDNRGVDINVSAGNGSIVGGQRNFGVFSNLVGNNTTGSINYGIYSQASGIAGTTPSNFPGTYSAWLAGPTVIGGMQLPSDATLKTDVKVETNMLEKVKALNPVNFMFIQDRLKTGFTFSKALQHGFIAQELEKVFPELIEKAISPIYNDKSEFIGQKEIKTVNYIELISVLVGAVKELSTEVQALKADTPAKTLVVNDVSKLSQSELDKLTLNAYSLDQNIPNPFSEFTVINYSLPATDKSASILILNLNGQLIKEYKLTEQKGSITINGGTLQKGMYLYTLISNNVEIITKKMIFR